MFHDHAIMKKKPKDEKHANTAYIHEINLSINVSITTLHQLTISRSSL